MPNKSMPMPVCVGILLTLPVLACMTHPAPARAQRVAYQTTFPRLQTKVHLELGATTAQEVADALSTQTGLKIEPAAYLRERRLNVEMDNVTCRDALNALAELNQWKWEEIGVGHIVWTRRVPPVPQKMPDVAPALIAALPRDWRTYLYVDIPWQEAMHASGTTSTRFGPADVRGAMSNRSARLINRQGETLLDTLRPALRKGEQRPYAQLTGPQREAVITVMMARALGETNYDLLHNNMTPYQLDFARATVEMRGVGFLVGTHREQQTARGTEKHFDYFGFEMSGRHTLPDSPPSDPLAPLSPP